MTLKTTPFYNLKAITFVAIYLIITLCCINAKAQDDYAKPKDYNNQLKKDSINKYNSTKDFLKKNLSYGGNIGLGYTNGLVIQLNPQINLKLVKYFYVGLNLNYTYLGSNNANNSLQIFGYAPFVQIRPIQSLILHAEYETIYVKYKNTNSLSKAINTAIVGAGLNYPLGSNFYANFLILWSLSKNNIYPNPIIRSGIFYGF